MWRRSIRRSNAASHTVTLPPRACSTLQRQKNLKTQIPVESLAFTSLASLVSVEQDARAGRDDAGGHSAHHRHRAQNVVDILQYIQNFDAVLCATPM